MESVKILRLMKGIEDKSPRNCYRCFSFALCYYGQNTLNMNDDDLLSFMNKNMRATNAEGVKGGGIVSFEKRMVRSYLCTPYIHLSSHLGIEKRGSGATLIRPPQMMKKIMKNMQNLFIKVTKQARE